MKRTGNTRAPLVAQRRKAAAAAAPKRRATRRRAPRRGNILTRLIGGVFGLIAAVIRAILRVIWGITWRVTAAVALVLGGATFYYYSTLPDLAELLDGRARGSVTMTDTTSQVFAWRGETFGGVITADTVSPHLKNAIIAVEDRRFYSHFGLSPRGIAGAMRSNMAAGRGPFSGAGGSTITQQTAKLLCLGVEFDPNEWDSEAAFEADCRRNTLWRKLQEVPFALALERRFSKDEILTLYMNRAFLGAGARGFEAAAQRYFGRSANEVNAAEAAMLAGLLIAPSALAPTRNLERAQARANVVLTLMDEQGFLTEYQLAEARAHPATLADSATQSQGAAFADWLMNSGPSWLTRNTTEDVLIETTFDPRIQAAAEDALREVFETRVREGSTAQAAIVVMAADGAVRAVVGGREARIGSFNRATQAMRQTGSAFKPFLYAAALENGFEPFDIVEDAPLTINIPGSGPWSPRNYTNDFSGMVTLTEALARSLNIPAVRVSEAMGREQVRDVATGFGIRSSLADGPAIALGSSEASLMEMTAAYAGILNGGTAVRPFGIRELRLLGESEPLMRQSGGVGDRVISERSARALTWMMHEVVESGTGGRARIPGWEVAGKTGTTQGARDAWFIGFTADYVAGVWMGYDDNSPLTGVTGGGLPATIWQETMARIHEGATPRSLPMDVPARQEWEAPVSRPDYGDPQPQQPATGPGARSTSSAIEDTIRGVLGGLFGN